jgi:hypothetical protein
MSYNWNIVGKTSRGGNVYIDTKARYGYWERLDGSEGGGLWFDTHAVPRGETSPLELTDYDGCYELRVDILDFLVQNNITVDEVYYPDELRETK